MNSFRNQAGWSRSVGQVRERDMSGLALLTSVIIVFASTVTVIGVSSLFTLTRVGDKDAL